MAFKMKGAPFQVHKPGHKGKPGEKVVDMGADENDELADAEYNKRLQPGEHSDTAVSNKSTKEPDKDRIINNLEDRIEALQSDIADSAGGAKYASMKKSLSTLQAQLRDTRKNK
jgi:hypothetical protein